MQMTIKLQILKIIVEISSSELERMNLQHIGANVEVIQYTDIEMVLI